MPRGNCYITAISPLLSRRCLAVWICEHNAVPSAIKQRTQSASQADGLAMSAVSLLHQSLFNLYSLLSTRELQCQQLMAMACCLLWRNSPPTEGASKLSGMMQKIVSCCLQCSEDQVQLYLAQPNILLSELSTAWWGDNVRPYPQVNTSCLPTTSEVGFTDMHSANETCTTVLRVQWMDGEWERQADMCSVNHRSVQWLAKINQISNFISCCPGWLHNNSVSLPSLKIQHLFTIPSLLINSVLHILYRNRHTSTMLVH